MSKRSAFGVVLGLALVAGCGSTRFVVVDDQPRREGAATSATTQPAAAAEAASAEDEAAIRKVVDQVLDPDERPFSDRVPLVVDGDDLESTFLAVRDLVKDLDAKVVVESVVVDGDNATATTSVTLGGEPFATNLPVTLVRVDNTWKITRAGACAVLALGSPCPDAPTGEPTG